MRRTRPITAFGWAVKKRLAELNLDQKEFCRRYGIPESRLSNLIRGARRAERYRKRVADVLGIDEED